MKIGTTQLIIKELNTCFKRMIYDCLTKENKMFAEFYYKDGDSSIFIE